ncbi:sigma-54-dependent Fis family transcriptional regulator [bacterium]|nr:sigma-54-dependent Fis family transcriptional regulator [bacterium]
MSQIEPRPPETRPEDHGLVGRSEAFLQAWELVKQVAPTQITVLITGESGTGKDMIARALHAMSPRREKPLLNVNCGAIPEGLLESELFGHEKGSFTGATDSRRGYFEMADGGTLFLDEIGELPLATQVKLLRVLETMEFMRVGGSRLQRVDVRVIAATNKDLDSAVSRGEFRRDLFYRLNAVKIRVPSLRERRTDIRDLALRFTDAVCRTNRIPFEGFTEDAFELLESYSWPGNVREMRNVIERVIVLEKGQRIDRARLESHLGEGLDFERNLPVITHKSSEQAERELLVRALLDIRMAIEEIRRLLVRGSGPRAPLTPVPPEQAPVVETLSRDFNLEELEKQQIERAIDRFAGNRRKAAKALGIGERTLYRKLKEYGIE